MEKFNSLLNSLPFQGKEAAKQPLSGILSPGQEKEAAKGFTLVELIVVITILAILGTIAFISLQGYSKDARDSVRISDISKIKTSLELFQLDAGKYPETTDSFNVTYSGAVAWTQGTFGETTFSSVEKLDKIPTDPVTDRKYVYSVTNTKQEYQIAGVMEGDEVSYNPLAPLSGGIATLVTETNAAGKTAMLKISGNYNGKLLKVSTGGTDYVLAVPSLITSSGTTLEQIVAEKLLAYNGYKNLPSLYAGSSYEVLGDDEINLINSDDLVVYSGSLSLLSDTTSTGVSARKILIENLQSAYAGTDITSVGEIAQIIDTNKNDSNAVEVLSSTIVNNDLGGNLVVTNSAPLIDKTTCESASWIRVEPENDVYIGSTKGNGFCISPRFGDWQTNGTDLDDGAGGISWNGWGNYSLDSYNGWDASNTSIRDTGNFTSQYGQTRTLDSEVSYNCKPLGTSGSDYETTDTIAGRMKWLATTGNTYYQARSIDWITGLVPHTVGTYPQAIPAIYIADCIDGVKDLGKDMEYKHYPDENLNEIITYAQYNTNETTDVGLIYLTGAIYQNRQKYLAAWTQKRGSHLPSAFSYITSGYASASDSDGKFLIGVDRGEYQVACDVGKFGAVTYNGINQYIGSNDDIDEESILLSAIGETTGASWGRRIRLSGSNGCGNQSYALATNRNGTLSARFVVRP